VQADPDFPAIDSDGKITLASRLSAFLFVLLLPSLGVLLASWMTWRGMVTRVDILIFIGMYVATGLGVTVGYHRLFTHRSFETSKLIRYTLAVCGAMAAEGAPVVWAAQHRQHHAFSDVPGDPHSPLLNRPPTFLGVLKGLLFAHYGHVFFQKETINPRKYAPDLVQEFFLLWMEKWSAIFVVAGFLIPGAIGWACTHTMIGTLSAILWGGFVRLFVITHATGAVNSICHVFGARRFETGDHSGNVWWLASLTLGESWHNGHHAFPTSARHGFVWWELDASWLVILVLEKTFLARNVIRIKRDHVERKRVKSNHSPDTIFLNTEEEERADRAPVE
jgi:stearoyl-CoA desaturase (delta-9 desaturase)